MKLIYSIGAKLASGGIGSIAYHHVKAMDASHHLHRLYCGAYHLTEISSEKVRTLGKLNQGLRKLATHDATGRILNFQSRLFDKWVSYRLEEADLLHVWNNYGLQTIQKANDFGMVTVVQRASTHPVYQAQLLTKEYEKWGITFRIPQAALQRSTAELQAADYVLIPSDVVRDSFVEMGFPAEKLIHVPFGCDTDRFYPAEKEGGKRPFRLLFVGKVGIRKGIPYLIEAWKQLNWPDAECWIVGQTEAASRPVQPQWQSVKGVKLLDHVPDPRSLFQQADLFVFPTIEEGSALVTYEAMACGLPVITTKNAGSVARHEQEGLIVPPTDANVLATAIERLRTDDRLRRQMSVAAAKRAKQFTWERANQTLLEHYEQIQSNNESK